MATKLILDENRRNEIAYKLLLWYFLQREKLQLRRRNEFMREVGNVAKETGVKTEEIEAFFKHITKEFVSEMFDGELDL